MDHCGSEEADEPVVSQASEGKECFGRPEYAIVVEVDYKKRGGGRRTEIEVSE